MAKLFGRIGPHKISLELVPDIEDAYASYRKQGPKREILISDLRNQDPKDLVDSVLHEAVHAAADIYGFEDKEILAHTLAAAFTQLFIETGLIEPDQWAKKLRRARK